MYLFRQIPVPVSTGLCAAVSRRGLRHLVSCLPADADWLGGACGPGKLPACGPARSNGLRAKPLIDWGAPCRPTAASLPKLTVAQFTISESAAGAGRAHVPLRPAAWRCLRRSYGRPGVGQLYDAGLPAPLHVIRWPTARQPARRSAMPVLTCRACNPSQRRDDIACHNGHPDTPHCGPRHLRGVSEQRRLHRQAHQ